MTDGPLSLAPVPTAPDAGPAALAGVATRFRDRVRARVGVHDLLVVRVGPERFGIPLDAIEELVEAPRPRTVPGADGALIGMFPSGERLIPLYSPTPFLGAHLAGPPVALVMYGGSRRLAMAVDDADDVIRVSLGEVRDAPRTARTDDFVLGLLHRDGELVAVLDARALTAAFAALGTGS
jgi:chemotaxis signal transduction protein